MISRPQHSEISPSWAKAHGLWNKISVQLSSPAVSIGTLAGAIHAAQEGAGVAIIPTHCITAELFKGSLLSFNSSKGKTALRPIYLAKRIGEPLPKRVELVMNMLKTAHN